MCDYTLTELETFFYLEISQTTTNYSSYQDLRHLSDTELWVHANNFGYKEQRKIFNDYSYNEAFYCNYLNAYRTQVLRIDPYFNWQIYIQSYSLAVNSEYYALLDFISKSPSNTLSISNAKSHYTITGEQPTYKKNEFLFHYGSGQNSTPLFGMVIPFKSRLLRGYFMYHYENEEPTPLEFSFNTSSTSIKLNLYIDGSNTNYYIEETLDPSKNMINGLLKQENILYSGSIINNATIILEQNSIISWYCSELISIDVNGEYTNYPYNPSRNRFIIVLELL